MPVAKLELCVTVKSMIRVHCASMRHNIDVYGFCTLKHGWNVVYTHLHEVLSEVSHLQAAQLQDQDESRLVTTVLTESCRQSLEYTCLKKY